MRLEVGVLFFLILNLVMYSCHGCGKEFDKAQGLHRHMNYCERAKTINQASNRTLQAATHKPSHAKLPRRQNNSQVENERRELRRQLNEDESEARLETSEEGPPVDFEPNDPGAGPSNAQLQAAPPLYTRSGRVRKIPGAYKDFLPAYGRIAMTHDLRRLVAPKPQPPRP
ncbi:hypothetical protein BC835DRAFT_1308418 [Cytidiella melzeri]|nr:hypothetical protein BC835DRAFT_1308418 [Cytidiella melzeri]